MHQGMIALMNCMLPRPFKMDFRKFSVPWTVFTEPQFSRVGLNEKELKEKGIKYEIVRTNYSDYGAAIAEGVEDGFIKAFVSKAGRIYGVYIIGENSGELINEWALAIQNRLSICKILMQQHSFPTMGFLTKRIAETWMMNRMKSRVLRKVCKWVY
jgi:pyruvate/2-oxoglutarate dehydrogenase complex dihydrolipoamide dehydrogenase (E3) component